MGRGYRKNRGGSRDGTILADAERTIDTRYIKTPTPSFGGWGWKQGRYTDTVLVAETDGNGNLTFSYPTAEKFEKTGKTNKTHYVTYKVQAGAINGETFNINWDKVKSVSGETYSIRKAAKDAGLKWDAEKKKWRRMD